ncbi:MAG: hypothetical protein WKG01_34470 [Kofleriaceae bacterium]
MSEPSTEARARDLPKRRRDITSDQPLRAELFSVSQLQRHARTIASWHEVSRAAARGSDWLLERLAANEIVLAESYRFVSESLRSGRQLTPAAEWFLDNYHLIEEQIRTARKHLPRSYDRELPRLANASTHGTPRVYHLALELISHAHGRVDVEGLQAFVAAYQEIQPLRLGELWAIPIMLRLALIENLRRVVMRVTAGRRERDRAAHWVGKMLEVSTNHPEQVVLVLAALIEEDPPLTSSFATELASRLQGRGPAVVFPLSWLEQRLAAQGETLEHVFELASQSQAADQVTIGNSIGSLRLLSATDWRTFVETMSLVDALAEIRRRLPAMEFGRAISTATPSRASRSAAISEDEVAHRVRLARDATGPDRHVGTSCRRGPRTLERATRAAADGLRSADRPPTPVRDLRQLDHALAAVATMLASGSHHLPRAGSSPCWPSARASSRSRSCTGQPAS